MKLIALLFLASAAAVAQPAAGPVYNVNADPAGSCSVVSGLRYNYTNGKLWGCDSGTWTQISGGGGGGGVTSVGLAGTANEITVTGTSPITSSGSWTLSLPAGLILPNGTTATTQAMGDNTTKVATTAFAVSQIAGVPFCTGFSPTTGQLIQYTTGSSPNPCYGAATGGAGNVTHTGSLGANQLVTGNSSADITTPNGGSTLDSSGNLVIPGTLSAGTTGTSGAVTLYDTGGSKFWAWKAPSTISGGGCNLVIPAGDPAGQVLQFAAPSGGNCVGSWVSAGVSPVTPYNPLSLPSTKTWSNYGGTGNTTGATSTANGTISVTTTVTGNTTNPFGQYYGVSGSWTHVLGVDLGMLSFDSSGAGGQSVGAMVTDGTQHYSCSVLSIQSNLSNLEAASGANAFSYTQISALSRRYLLSRIIYFKLTYAAGTPSLNCDVGTDGNSFPIHVFTSNPGFTPTGTGYIYDTNAATIPGDSFTIFAVN